MNPVGLREIPLSAIRLPGDFKKRLEAPHVAERAKSITADGLIHRPLVRRVGKQWEVICGLDRVAAHFVAGKEAVDVEIRECTDEEAHRLRRVENVQRRHDPTEQSRLALELLEKFTEEEATLEEAMPQKPKSSARGRARKRVASELGISAETVRKKEWEEATRDKPPEIRLHALGMTLSAEFKTKVAKAAEYLDAAELDLKRAQAKLTAMANDLGITFPKPRLERLREEIHAQATHVRGLKPVSLCPWCKGLNALQEHCSACFGSGFITKNQAKAIPPELLDEAAPMVMSEGKAVSVYDFVPQPEYDLEAVAPGEEPLGDDW